jgi:hypothetical protein
LRVEYIQAKGRVERADQTLQDRLIKKNPLASIFDIAGAQTVSLR